MTSASLLDQAVIRTNPDIVFGDVDGDIVALNLQLGSYLHLNSSGSFVFGLLDGSEARSFDWLCERVRDEYVVDAAVCRQEVGAFVNRCVELDLLRLETAEAR